LHKIFLIFFSFYEVCSVRLQNEMDVINEQIVQYRDSVDVRTKRLEMICSEKQVNFIESQIKLLQHKYQAHVSLCK
jgi:hypothetical protein